MAQPHNNNSGSEADSSAVDEAFSQQLPQLALQQGPISIIPGPTRPLLQAFAQEFYSLPFLPTEDDLNRMLWHNGELGFERQNIQPSELVQFLRRPRFIPRGLLLAQDDVVNNNQAHVRAEDNVHDRPAEQPAASCSESPPAALPESPVAPLAEAPVVPVAEASSPPSPQSPTGESASSQPSQAPEAAEPAASLPPYHTATFPPGRDRPEFVPFGINRQAIALQGNYWPIDPDLRGEIVHAELDNHKRRPQHQRLTYREILDKYTEWNPVEGVKGGVVASTLRGYNRRYTIPDKSNRVRRPQWQEQHLRALRKAVPRATGRKGNVSWKAVRESVEAATGRPFGLATLSAKWRELKGMGKWKGKDRESEESSAEDSQNGEDGDEEAEEEGMEVPDEQHGIGDDMKGRKRDGDEDEDDSSAGGATQAPGFAIQRSAGGHGLKDSNLRTSGLVVEHLCRQNLT